MQAQEVTEILVRIDRLWPKCDWTPEARMLFAEKIGRFDREQVLAVVDEARAVGRWSSPNMGDIVKGCRAADAAGSTPGRSRKDDEACEIDPPGLTWAAWADRELQSGKPRHPDHNADLWNIAEGRDSRYEWVRRAQVRERTGKYPPTLREIATGICGPEDAERERLRKANIQRSEERDLGIA